MINEVRSNKPQDVTSFIITKEYKSRQIYHKVEMTLVKQPRPYAIAPNPTFIQ